MQDRKINKQLLERWKGQCEKISSTTFEFVDDENREKRIARARRDYSYFVKTYFGVIAPKDCGKFQIDAANKIKANSGIRALFEWARGHAKSTHISLLIPIWLLIQEKREINVMVLASKSEDMAKRLLSDIQAELECNKALISDFGTFKGVGSWSDGEFRTADGRLFIAVGRGQSPRGIKNNEARRPDYIVVDDIDDDELIHNKTRVDKATRWLLSALFNTMDAGRGRFVMVGNRIGKISILSNIAQRVGIYHTIVNMLDRNGEPSWKENITKAEIQSIRDFIGERNFQQEYMNNPIVEGTIFQEKYIKYGKILDLRKYRTLICYTDPSFKNSSNSDFKATMLIGKTPKGEYHLIKAYCDQTTVKNMVEWHYDISNFIDGQVPVMYYMESNFMQDSLLDEFKKEGNERGDHIAIRGDNRKKPDKFARIEAMQPLFERGLFMINENERESLGVINLVEQLMMFERGSKVHDDAPDAVEGAIYLLNKRTTTCDTKYVVGKRQSMRY